MINVYDFCSTCEESTTIKLSFFDIDSDIFITTVLLDDAKTGCKALSAVCSYAYVECFYISANIICAKVRLHKCDM